MSVPETIRSRDRERILTLHPDMRTVVRTILDTMERLGFPMTVTAAVRTQAEQQALFAKGRTQPGAIVTNADGVIKKSNHQPKDDGFGRAADLAFLVDGADRDGELETPSWDELHPWNLYGTLAETLGKGRIIWGGRWVSLRDLPHIEWRDA